MEALLNNRPAREAEQARFCEEWLDRNDYDMQKIIFIVSIIWHTCTIFIIQFIADESVVLPLRLLSAFTLAIFVPSFFFMKQIRWRRLVLASLMIVVMAGYLYLLRYCVDRLSTGGNLMKASGAALMIVAFGVQLFPYRGVALFMLAAASAAGGFIAAYGADGGGAWAYIFFLLVVIATSLRHMTDRRLMREARSEFRFRSQIAPAHIVRHAARDTNDLTTLFQPELKFCVCLSTDWRNYQELSGSISPSQLAMALNEYYDLCHELLNRHLPEGNFFTDWIADELFVVLFAVKGVDEARLVDAAVAFAAELLGAKAEFLRLYGLPRAVDIGIAAGEALVGLMGPEGLRKATAMGEVPGRARRLQSAGKFLRRRVGEADRIVLGRESLLRLRAPFAVQPLTLAGSEGIRDLKDREIFYVEPAGLDPARRAGAS